MSVAVVEERYWGGVCLNVGCIPSKALLRNAELAHLFTHEAKTFGIRVDGQVTFDYREAFQRSRKVADGRVRGVHYLMKKNGITEFDGTGVFTDAHTMRVRGSDGTEQTVDFDHCILATGATTRLLPGTSLSERVVTYEEQILSDRLPGSIIIAGAGAIGVEFAYVLHNYGVQVTLVEFMDRVVPLEDEEVSAELARRYRKLGVNVLTSTRVEAIHDEGPQVRVHVTTGGQRQVLEADKVHRLPAAGDRLRFGEHRRTPDRPRGGRGRRAMPHERPAHLRDRRCHGTAHARARGRGHGHGRRRDHRGRGDDGTRLHHDPACHLLSAADRQLRLDRGPGA
jgi:dihydrolipoamide dehydrogenase